MGKDRQHLRNPGVREMIDSYLHAHGYDGLYSTTSSCSCHISNLMPCGPGDWVARCRAGHMRPGTTDKNLTIDTPDY